MDTETQLSLSNIQLWLKNLLDTEDVPSFEVNDQTLSILHTIKENYEGQIPKNEVLKQQMLQETEEFRRDKSRMKFVLKNLECDPNVGLSPKSKRYMKALCSAMDALGSLQGSLPILVVAVAQLLSKINLSTNEVKELEEMNSTIQQQCKDAEKLFNKLQTQHFELEAQLPSEQKNVESLQKSSKFHSQKRKQYEGRMAEMEGNLAEIGCVGHDDLVRLGEHASHLDDRLKPLLMQLNAYKDIPADLNLARVKLHEVIDELRLVEDELHETFHNMSLLK